MRFFQAVIDADEDLNPNPTNFRSMMVELLYTGSCVAGICPCPSTDTDILQLNGSPSVLITRDIVIRGVFEQKTYSLGTLDGKWYVGGVNAGGSFNSYRLVVTNVGHPELNQVYYLNPVTIPDDTNVICQFFGKSITFRGNAKFTLIASSIDDQETENIEMESVPDIIPGYPILFNQPLQGQAVQIDFTSMPSIKADSTQITADNESISVDTI